MSDDVRLRKVKDAIMCKFEYSLDTDGGAITHNYLLPLYLQLQILDRLESIDVSLAVIAANTEKEKPVPSIGNVEFVQDGKRYKGIIQTVEDDE
jgi:hypothetical protein